MKNISFMVLAVIFLLGGCRKDVFTDTTTTTTATIPVELVQATVFGKVINEQGIPVEGAKVSLRNVLKPSQVIGEVSTDENGVFMFRNKTVNGNGTYISVAASTYFHGSRTIYPQRNAVNQVTIQLLSNEATKTIASASAGGVADYTDYSVTLPANGVMTESGDAYSGAVKVAAKWLNPTSSGFGLRVPGDFRGVRTDESLTTMISMGMLAVELSDASGNLLQVKTGAEAEIKMRVPQALAASAPATIPLWYFDEAAGIWVEEGVATLQNGFYVGKVKHFSFWNYDTPFPAINLTVNVQDEAGNPISGATVTLTQNSGSVGYGWTDNNGQTSGMVPIDQAFVGNVYLNIPNCNGSLLTQNIGPFSADATVTFTVPTVTLYTYTLSGNLVNCDNAPVLNGYVQLQNQSTLIYVDSTGHFDETIITCEPMDNIAYTGYDYDAIKASLTQNTDIAVGSNDLGTITVCEDIPQYFTYTFGGETFEYFDHTIRSHEDSIATGPAGLYITRYANQQTELNIGLSVDNVTGLGTYTPRTVWVEGQGGVAGPFVYHFCQQCTTITVNVTEYNGVNGYVSGTYSGTITSPNQQPQQTIDISGTFRGILEE